MKRILLAAAIAAAVAAPAHAALEAGAAAPAFKTQASVAGKALEYRLADELKRGPVVVYFYPSAYTGGCNVQAHTFAVNADKFAAAGASIVGVSLDSIERLNDFSADPEYCAGKFPVASDADGSISKSYQLQVREAAVGKKDSRGKDLDHGFAERTTFIVGKDGKIVSVVGGVKVEENVQQALVAVQKLAVQ